MFSLIYEQLTQIELAVYTPAELILASRKSNYEESYRDDLEGISRNVSLAGYASDAVKINIKQIFKALSPHTELKTL